MWRKSYRIFCLGLIRISMSVMWEDKCDDQTHPQLLKHVGSGVIVTFFYFDLDKVADWVSLNFVVIRHISSSLSYPTADLCCAAKNIIWDLNIQVNIHIQILSQPSSIFTFKHLGLNRRWQSLSRQASVSLCLFARVSDGAKDRGRLQSVLVEAGITHSFHTVDGGRITCVNAYEAEARRQ